MNKATTENKAMGTNKIRKKGSPPTIRREVSFSKIEIREYERSIGDNVVSSGVPISLGWGYKEADELDLSAHEEVRRHRSHDDLKLPGHVRMKLLRKFGYSMEDQLEAAEQSNEARKLRLASAAKTVEQDRAEYALEKAKRHVHKMRTKTARTAKEQEKEEIEKLIEQDRQRTRHASRSPTRRTSRSPVRRTKTNPDKEPEKGEGAQQRTRYRARVQRSKTAPI